MLEIIFIIIHRCNLFSYLLLKSYNIYVNELVAIIVVLVVMLVFRIKC